MTTNTTCTTLAVRDNCPSGEICGGCPEIEVITEAPTKTPTEVMSNAPTAIPTELVVETASPTTFLDTDAGYTTVYLGTIFILLTLLCYRDRVRFLMKENDRKTRLAAREAASPKKGDPKAAADEEHMEFKRKRDAEIYCDAFTWLLARLFCVPLCQMAMEKTKPKERGKKGGEKGEGDGGDGKKKKKKKEKGEATDDEFVDLT